jgi:2-haloacid dehalogenase
LPADYPPPLRGIRVCAFDAYGTLFDVNSAAVRLSAELGEKVDRLAAVWRTKQLEYSWLRSLMGRHADFWQVTGDALDFALEEAGIADGPIRERLMSQYLNLDAYEDARPVLDLLRSAGLKLCILSNGAPAMLDAATSSAGLGDYLDAVLSVEQAGIFKPHPKAYRIVPDRFDVPKEAVCFVSSNGWDTAGAASFGFQVAWLNRAGRTPERLPAKPAAEIGELQSLPHLLGLTP